MMTSGAIEALELFGKAFLDPRRHGRRGGPDLHGRDHVLPASRRTSSPCRSTTRGCRSTSWRRCWARGSAEAPLHDPGLPEPGRRHAVAERRPRWSSSAAAHGFLIIEDVAYRELGFDGDAAPSLWSLAPDVVVQAGTFSKIFFPGVRLGWAAGPPEVSRSCAAPSSSPTSAPARSASGCRGVRPPRAASSARSPAPRALYASHWRAVDARAAPPHARRASRGPTPTGGFFTWLTLPAARRDGARGRARSRRGSPYVPGLAVLRGGRRRARGAALVQPRDRGRDRARDPADRVPAALEREVEPLAGQADVEVVARELARPRLEPFEVGVVVARVVMEENEALRVDGAARTSTASATLECPQPIRSSYSSSKYCASCKSTSARGATRRPEIQSRGLSAIARAQRRLVVGQVGESRTPRPRCGSRSSAQDGARARRPAMRRRSSTVAGDVAERQPRGDVVQVDREERRGEGERSGRGGPYRRRRPPDVHRRSVARGVRRSEVLRCGRGEDG